MKNIAMHLTRWLMLFSSSVSDYDVADSGVEHSHSLQTFKDYEDVVANWCSIS